MDWTILQLDKIMMTTNKEEIMLRFRNVQAGNNVITLYRFHVDKRVFCLSISLFKPSLNN
jgi:hypothetical protein